MIKTIINKITTKVVLALGIFLSVSTAALADGSKDLYPDRVGGHRAMLLGNGYTSGEALPFTNAGAHYVYAKAGEIITLASSAQGFTGNSDINRIVLYSPSGAEVVNDNRNGKIANRSEEKGGPRLRNKNSSGSYTPIYYEVPAGGEGVYRVEFTSRRGSGAGPILSANAEWDQSNDAGIRAWDVSVINASNTAFIAGRVYATNLNLTNGNGSNYEDVSFQGKFFVRTNDGFTYRVTHKGSSGIVWAFFVNNKGFFDRTTKNPLYKSMNSEASGVRNQIHNPNSPDNDTNITHKIYYTKPAKDMPATAKVAVSDNTTTGLTTWLNPTIQEPEVSNIKVIGAEGSPGFFGHKGGTIEFDAAISGQQYAIEVVVTNEDGSQSVFKKLDGTTISGRNKISWNGIGTNGRKLSGKVPVNLKIQLQGAEVHFPFFDMEYNKGGIAIELLNYNNLDAVISDLVYWNDTDIPNVSNGANVDPKNNSHLNGSLGISSNSNGHKWGEGGRGANNTFGDKKSMDTWTFRVGNQKTLSTFVNIQVADLYSNVTYKIDNETKQSAHKGSTIEYTVVAGNNGPSDIIADIDNGIHGAPFTFTVPPGVDLINPNSVRAIFSCANGLESIPLRYDAATRTFYSELQLPNNCTVTYKVTGKLNGMTGSMIAESTIMRPADVTDPDATNGYPGDSPTNPHFECYNNVVDNLPGDISGTIGCNNINEAVFMALGDCVEKILYFEDFDRGYFAQNSGRTDWSQKNSISIGTNGEILMDGNTVRRLGPKGGATASYRFAPGINDTRYNGANGNPHSDSISVARIKNGYYSVNPPGYVQMGIPTTDSWHEGVWVPNAPTNDPNIANSNFDWTPAWDKAGNIRDMSGSVNGAAFLVRGAASAAQSIKPFYEFELQEKIQKDKIYTLDLYSYVTYHDKDYMIMDVLDKDTGHIYASVPLKYGGAGLPAGASPTGFSLGWVSLTASFSFADAACANLENKDVKIAIRGSQDRALETGKGFGHTLIDNITFSKRTTSPSCTIPVTNVTCADDCYQDVVGKGFGWYYSAQDLVNTPTVVQKFEQPAANGGFILDIYRLDNSFNMIINGVPLFKDELEFESWHSKRNVRFKGSKVTFGEWPTSDVWNVNANSNGNGGDNSHIDLENRANNPIPVIQVRIDKWGNVTLWGKKNTGDMLEEMEVFDINSPGQNIADKRAVPLDVVHWIPEGNQNDVNKIDVTQSVIGQTMMFGFGYGLEQKECETFTFTKDGVFADENGNGFAEVGETITYTFEVKNLGDMDIYDVVIEDRILGMNISLDPTTHQPPAGVTLDGDDNPNNRGVLNRNETWTFTVSYKVTSHDVFTVGGVYNRATVKGIGKLLTSERNISAESTDPTPYRSGDPGWDPTRPYYTYVQLKGSGLLITNPMIYQKIKNL